PASAARRTWPAMRAAPVRRGARRRARPGARPASPRPVSASEQGQGRLVKAAVGGEGAAAVDRGRPGEIGEASARLLDEDLARRQVPGLEIGLEVDLRLALGDHRVAEVVTEAAL